MNVDPTYEIPDPLTSEELPAAERLQRTTQVRKALVAASNELDRLGHSLAAADVEMALDRLRRLSQP